MPASALPGRLGARFSLADLRDLRSTGCAEPFLPKALGPGKLPCAPDLRERHRAGGVVPCDLLRAGRAAHLNPNLEGAGRQGRSYHSGRTINSIRWFSGDEGSVKGNLRPRPVAFSRAGSMPRLISAAMAAVARRWVKV